MHLDQIANFWLPIGNANPIPIPNSSTENTLFCEFLDSESFLEMYDLATDPDQLDNLAHTLTAEDQELFSERIDFLRKCKGKWACRN